MQGAQRIENDIGNNQVCILFAIGWLTIPGTIRRAGATEHVFIVVLISSPEFFPINVRQTQLPVLFWRIDTIKINGTIFSCGIRSLKNHQEWIGVIAAQKTMLPCASGKIRIKRYPEMLVRLIQRKDAGRAHGKIENTTFRSAKRVTINLHSMLL
jgi:hypothetical protein